VPEAGWFLFCGEKERRKKGEHASQAYLSPGPEGKDRGLKKDTRFLKRQLASTGRKGERESLDCHITSTNVLVERKGGVTVGLLLFFRREGGGGKKKKATFRGQIPRKSQEQDLATVVEVEEKEGKKVPPSSPTISNGGRKQRTRFKGERANQKGRFGSRSASPKEKEEGGGKRHSAALSHPETSTLRKGRKVKGARTYVWSAKGKRKKKRKKKALRERGIDLHSLKAR